MKAKIKTSLIIMLSLALILISTNVYARSGITTSETTRIRSEASTSASTVVLLPVNTEVEIVGEDGDWYQVEYENYSGYIRKDLLEETETSEDEDEETTDATEENNNEESSTETETAETEETGTTENTDSNEEISEENTSVQEKSTVKAGDQGTLLEDASMRILPSINSSIIAEISASTTYTVVEVINNWCHIEVGNYSGWVFLSKIDSNKQESETTDTTQSTETTQTDENTEENTTTEEEETTSSTTTTTKYVSAETLNMRETADSSATIITQLALNTEVTVVEEVNTVWTKITYNGYTGYVASQYLSDSKTTTTSRSETTTRSSSTSTSSNSSSTTETDTTSSSSSDTEESTSSSSSDSTSSSTSSKGSEVAALAKQYVGYKYVSGGASPSTGFDCSGLVYYVYKQFGVTLNRTATGQSSNGTAVSKSNLQPGDIIVFNNSSNTSIGHVGIYIGSNTFVHAANSKKGVITTSLSDSYYSARYVTARRIFN